MSISSEITRINTNIANAYTACNNKSATMPQIQNSANLATTIASIPSGSTPTGTINITTNGTHDVTNYATANVSVSGGGSIEPSDVNFYDYDGTLLHSYTAQEFANLTEMPANPTHTGLTSDGWNWDLNNAKTFVATYGILDIGQMYYTTSGDLEIDIELTKPISLTFTLNLNSQKDWGDGTIDSNTSHTYAATGNYTIKTSIMSFPSGLAENIFGEANYSVKRVRVGNNTNGYMTDYLFQNCYGLESITFSKKITGIQTCVFQNCRSLKYITIPQRTQDFDFYIVSRYNFNGCYNLKNISLPKDIIITGSTDNTNQGTFSNCYNLTRLVIPKATTLTSNDHIINNSFVSSCYGLEEIVIPLDKTVINSSAFRYLYSLKKIKLPSTITSIATYAFQNTLAKTFDFSDCASIPTLANVNAFGSINTSAKIIVPDALYNDWIATSVWSNLSAYIVRKSDV